MGELHAAERAGTDAAEDSLIGQLIDGRYRVLALISTGGMARVYRAVDERLDRVVAVKILNESHVGNSRFVESFAAEAKLTARLSHPNVVAVFDQGEHGGLPYVVMEYVEGRTLRQVLNEYGAVSPDEALYLMERILAGLAEAHRIGLVHRDVKPENILLSYGSGGDVVKVADFGLAHVDGAEHGRANPDPEEPLLATVAYVAPEIVADGRCLSSSDVYSAGILLYELVTGTVPFDGPDPMTVAYQHVDNDVPPARRLVPDLPEVIDAVIARATARDVARRPADADGLAQLVAAAARRIGDEEQPDRRRGMTVGRQRRSSAGDPMRRDRPMTIRAAVTQFVAASIVLFLIAVGGWWLAAGRYEPAPSLLDQTAEGVADYAAQHGLSVEFDERRFSETVPEGMVMDQDPGPGERVASGGTITVVISKGHERYEIPDLVGEWLDAGTARLARLNLEVRVTQVFDEHVGHGDIVSTDPVAGTTVRPRTVVRLNVSMGSAPATVPNVVGSTEASAVERLRQEGVTPLVTHVFDDSVERGKVITQDPAPGTGVEMRTSVAIQVSRGPVHVEVPDVVGMSVDDAVAALERAGFEARVHGAGKDPIIRQSPVGGSGRESGAEVDLWVRDDE